MANDLVIDTNILPMPSLPKNSYKFQVLFYEGYPYEYMGKSSVFVDILEAKKRRPKWIKNIYFYIILDMYIKNFKKFTTLETDIYRFLFCMLL